MFAYNYVNQKYTDDQLDINCPQIKYATFSSALTAAMRPTT